VHRAEGNYRDEVISKILYMGSREKFSLVTDFAWYTSILLELALLQGTKHGKEVAEQLIEISLRVDTVRPFAVEAMLSMLLNEDLILGQARSTVSEVSGAKVGGVECSASRLSVRFHVVSCRILSARTVCPNGKLGDAHVSCASVIRYYAVAATPRGTIIGVQLLVWKCVCIASDEDEC